MLPKIHSKGGNPFAKSVKKMIFCEAHNMLTLFSGKIWLLSCCSLFALMCADEYNPRLSFVSSELVVREISSSSYLLAALCTFVGICQSGQFCCWTTWRGAQLSHFRLTSLFYVCRAFTVDSGNGFQMTIMQWVTWVLVCCVLWVVSWISDALYFGSSVHLKSCFTGWNPPFSLVLS